MNIINYLISSYNNNQNSSFISCALPCCWEGREVTHEDNMELLPLITNEVSTVPSISIEKMRVSLGQDLRDKEVLESVTDVASIHLPSVSSLQTQVVRKDPDYGLVTLQQFSPTWLQDYPQVIEHIESEHLLHVKGLDDDGQGMTWHTAKFKTDMDPRFNPEARFLDSQKAGIQMKMGYFIIPPNKLDLVESLSLTKEVAEEMKVYDDQVLVGYRFFVHPEAYDHFRSLHQDPKIKFVQPKDSEFVSTPTSSYRSLATRRVEAGTDGILVPAKGSIPFIVKVGVGGSILGSDRWLSTAEIERSVQCQTAFDGMDNRIYDAPSFTGKTGSSFSVFPENMGIILKGIENYPPKIETESTSEPAKASGVLIREFPKQLLEGKERILSMAALMSPERVKIENQNVGTSHLGGVDGFERLPLIFEVMQATINKGLADSPEDFIHKYLIVAYIDAIEGTTFQENMPIEPHSQNLCMVLNNDLTPKGYAYRDHGGIWVDLATRGLQGKDMSAFHREKGDGNTIFKSKGAIRNYIASYSWFYRYQVFIKTMNILTHSPVEYMPAPNGAPSQIGCDKEMEERNLQGYVFKKLGGDSSCQSALKNIKTLSLTYEQYEKSLQLLDQYYLNTMNRYFDLDKVGIEMKKNALPAAEGGSPDEKRMLGHKGFLGKYRFNQISSGDMRVKIEDLPSNIKEKIEQNVITSFGNLDIKTLNVQEIMLLKEGVALFDKKSEIVGFSPYSTVGEKKWIAKQIKNTLELNRLKSSQGV